MTVLEVAVDQTIAGSQRPVVNIFHVNTIEGRFVQAAATSVRNRWIDHILLSQTNQITADRVRVRSLDGIDFAETLIGSTGANASQAVPPQIAVLVRKTAPGLPRKRYGKMYLVGLPEVDVSAGGVVDSTALGHWQTRMTALLDGLRTDGNEMVQPEWVVTGGVRSMVDFHPVTQLLVQSRIATQRRRNRK